MTQTNEEEQDVYVAIGEQDAYVAIYDAGYRDGRLAGMVEVVEWLEKARNRKLPKYQLKKWGIL